jgi:protein-tyrosine kinase
MVWKQKGSVMKDSFGSLRMSGRSDGASTSLMVPGMRHSVRPRRSVTHANLLDDELVAETRPMHPRAPIEEAPRWHELRQVAPGTHGQYQGEVPTVDLLPDSATSRAFDLLRTRLRQSTQEHGWRNIAITAPTSGCGNTFTAINLALSLSRVRDSRTLLMDLNMRDPGIAEALGMRAPGPIRGFLEGTTGLGDHLVRVNDTLALGLNDAPDGEAAATLLHPRTGLTLDRVRAALRPDLVLYDMPPMLTHDDVSAFLPQLDGVLLVSDGTQTMARQLVECERMLDGQVPLLGVILNRARTSSLKTYH